MKKGLKITLSIKLLLGFVAIVIGLYFIPTHEKSMDYLTYLIWVGIAAIGGMVGIGVYRK